MRFSDIFSLSLMNLQRQRRKNIGVMIILIVTLLVFNLTCSLVRSLKTATESNITNNRNLKTIEVSTVEDEIPESLYQEMASLNHVDNIFYNYSLGCSIEKEGNATEINVLGLETEQAAKLAKQEIELKDYEIILNENDKKKGYQVGDVVTLSYNCMISESQGRREEKQYTIVGFYEQPVISSWYEDVALISMNCMFEICGSQYGLSAKEIKDSNIYKESIMIFADETDYVSSIAEYAENKGLLVSYALMSSEELPVLAKIIIAIGAALIVILVVMSIVIINATINHAVRGRYREIGILKAIGIRETEIRKMLYLELLMLWGIVAFVSSLLSILAVIILAGVPFADSMGDVMISWVQIVIGIAATLFIIWGTTFVTVKRTSKLKVVEVLRYE